MKHLPEFCEVEKKESSPLLRHKQLQSSLNEYCITTKEYSRIVKTTIEELEAIS